ncbi:MAG: DedA family protein [Thermodesulfobacteria bacterium]|nr:DedA family protein [Thermodesulfobacteriota bacterium]
MLKELTEIINLLLLFFEKSGYLGIFLCMAIESTVVPLPSELVIPPAAYLAYQGKMNFFWVVLLGTLGSLAGALVNYFVALRIGRPAFFLFVKKYGKFFLLSEESFLKVEKFWDKHGHISVFVGRLLPGFRHLVSIPAGLTRMNLGLFSLYTALGAGLWCLFLAVCGYFFGKNSELLKSYLHKGSFLIILLCGLIIAIYVFYRKHFKKEAV